MHYIKHRWILSALQCKCVRRDNRRFACTNNTHVVFSRASAHCAPINQNYTSALYKTHTCYSKQHSYLYTSTLNNTHQNVQSTNGVITSMPYNVTHVHIAFCACTVPRHWYSVGVCMLSTIITLPWKSPRLCSGCAMLCLLGIIPTLK